MRKLFAALTTLLVLLVALAVPVTAAAATCELTTAVDVGHSITITGTGYGPTTTVHITTTWSGSSAVNGGNTGPQTTTSTEMADGSGQFVHVIDAGPGHGGTYDVSATDGTCTSTTKVAALETAGGTNPGGGTAGQTMPPTDTDPIVVGPADASPGLLAPVLVAGFALSMAFVALRIRRGQRVRTDR